MFEVDSEFLRQLYYMVNLRLWSFLIPVAGAIVGSWIGVMLFYALTGLVRAMRSKKAKLERRLGDAHQRILEDKAELAEVLKDNRRLQRELAAAREEIEEQEAAKRGILELAKRRASR